MCFHCFIKSDLMSSNSFTDLSFLFFSITLEKVTLFVPRFLTFESTLLLWKAFCIYSFSIAALSKVFSIFWDECKKNFLFLFAFVFMIVLHSCLICSRTIFLICNRISLKESLSCDEHMEFFLKPLLEFHWFLVSSA